MEVNNGSGEQALPFSYKIIIIGDSGSSFSNSDTGKTSLIERFKNDVFRPFLPTIGKNLITQALILW